MRPKPRPYICTACLRHTLPTRSLTTTPNPTPSSPPSKPTPSPTTKKPLHDLTPRDHNYYWETTPPSASQLASASTFFTPTPTSPALLWSAAKFRTTPTDSQRPEVAFLGRSNVGKSSVLNAILGREICHTSSKPGRTREMNAFGIGMSATATDGPGAQPRIVLLDMPGYGKASRAEWGVEIMKYLKGRRQLRRTFLLIDSDHGPKSTDISLLSLLRIHAIPHQIILSKADKVLAKRGQQQLKTGVSTTSLEGFQRLMRELRPVVQPDPSVAEGPVALGEILAVSAETQIGRGRGALGVNAIRWAILSAAGLGDTL